MNTPLMAGTTGLNTLVDPTRLQMNEQGLRAIVRCQNMVVDASGRLDRVPGYEEVETGVFHSGMSGGPLVVKDGWLCRVLPDGTTQTLTELTEPILRVDYAWHFDRIYWSNGVDCGYVAAGENHAWAMDDWPGPGTNKQFASTAGHLLTELDGSLWTAVDDHVYWSLPGLPTLQWRDGDFMTYPSRVRLLKSVTDGVWIGDGAGIFFVTLEPLAEILRAAYPAIPGTAAYVEEYPYEELTGRAIRVATARGICFLGPGGVLINETQRKIGWRDGAFAAAEGAAVVWQDRYHVTLEP